MDLATHIQSNPYLRERLLPKPGDSSYLHLSDLRAALTLAGTDRQILLLDYGCGGSPYRSLFPNASYRRADYLQNPGDDLEYVLDETSRVAERDETFDFILSTQVLEHVGSPQFYLRECFRLLKPGGQVFITTHGSYPDHECPHDFYRWTLDGLIRDLKSAGFGILQAQKMTTGPRALIQQCDYQFQTMFATKRSLFGMLLMMFRRSYVLVRPWLHTMCDKYFFENRVVTQHHELHVVYHAIGCLAQKP